ncbi:MAG: serine/threonine-protein kinase [bacterium]
MTTWSCRGTRRSCSKYLGGGCIADLLAQGPVPVPSTVEMGIRVAEALHYAHLRGVVHRDIKPANIMLVDAERADTVRITDYGVAKTANRSPDLTVAGANVGTVWYMSPEQFNHEDPTPGFDIYSLGATLYELLTGTIPFAGKDTAEIFRRFLDGVPAPAITDRSPTVPPALATVVEAAMALDRHARVPTAAVLALLLRAVAEREGLGLGDAAARRLFHQADGSALRRMVQQLEQTAAGRPVAQAVTALDLRLNGASAVTGIHHILTPDLSVSGLVTASMNVTSLLPIVGAADEADPDEEDHTLVSIPPRLLDEE